jgi:hypothetical protein
MIIIRFYYTNFNSPCILQELRHFIYLKATLEGTPLLVPELEEVAGANQSND